MFEFAVIAAASIGVHMAGEGYDARFVTDAGEVPRQGTFRDTLLDTLAVIRPSRDGGLGAGSRSCPRRAGRSSPSSGCSTPGRHGSSRRARRGTAPGLAMLLVPGEDDGDWSRQTATCAQTLIGAGWRVATVPDAVRLAPAWQELHQAGAAMAGAAMAGTAAAMAGTAAAGPAGTAATGLAGTEAED